MAWLSGVKNVTSVNNLFSSGLYHALWQECDRRMQRQERFATLNDTQRHIATDVALRTIATERSYGPIIGDVFDTPFMLLWSLHNVNKREKIFPTDRYPIDDQADLLALLETAGSIVFEWEQEHGRFPSREENADFCLETVRFTDTCDLIYDLGMNLSMSPYIKADKT